MPARSPRRPDRAPLPLLAGKRGLVMGVANNHSIAWGIAEALHRQGAALAFTYQNEVLGKRLFPLAESVGSSLVAPCDVSDPDSIDAAFDRIAADWPQLDFVIHAIAHSHKEELKGRYIDTSLENFLSTMHVSCYSFTSVARRAAPMMTSGGNLLTLTYEGARRVMPNYNVMGVAKAALEASVRYMAADLGDSGIRVNAISAGPMRTLAGSAIEKARFVYSWQGTNAPLQRNITSEDIGGTAVYLLSDLATAVTGSVVHVDGGYNTVGMARIPN